jgi:hypothetical protein
VLEFTDAEIRAKAEKLGYDPAALTPPQLAKVKVILMEERAANQARSDPDDPFIAGHITIRPGASIELDGHRLPAASESVEVTVSADPDVPSTVRLTLLVDTVQTIKE